jgi:hypothetical protein
VDLMNVLWITGFFIRPAFRTWLTIAAPTS